MPLRTDLVVPSVSSETIMVVMFLSITAPVKGICGCIMLVTISSWVLEHECT